VNESSSPSTDDSVSFLMSGPERKAVITFDEMFFLYARSAAARSKDPRSQCGACIVKNRHVVGIGYNGFTKGVPDYERVWATKMKYQFVEHAERNAIHNADRGKLAGSSLYLWTSRNYPTCPDCAKAIVQNGIVEVHLPFVPEAMNAEGLHWDVVAEIFRCASVSVIWNSIDLNGVMKRIMEWRPA